MLLALVMTLVACNNPNRETFDEAYQALNIVVPGNDPTKVINLFTVPTELRGGVTATWTSSDTVHAAITSAGGITTVNVVRPGENEEDVTVTLTAALSYEGVTGNKTFQIIILKLPETTIYTLREIRDEEVAAGTDVKIENVTVVTVDDDAYHLYDGDTAMLVFLNSQPLVNVGDHGTIVAKVAIYFDGYQLIDVTWLTSTPGQEETPVEVVLSDYWMKDIDENVEAIKAVKQDSDLFTYITFDAKVVVRSDFTGGANYQYTLVDPESESDDENFVLTYYKNQNHRDIVAYDGLMVTVVATIRELRDNRTTNATIGTIPVFSMSVASFEVGELSEEQKVAVDKGLLNLETNFVEAGTLELPEVGEFESTIAWTFKTPADPNNVYL
ncbi:MAG: hypothetical protein IH571_07160, partial [Acholeplasmataceae bacterium]|nr:hypothetical protein [Acholeplasmataceae bacterium]